MLSLESSSSQSSSSSSVYLHTALEFKRKLYINYVNTRVSGTTNRSRAFVCWPSSRILGKPSRMILREQSLLCVTNVQVLQITIVYCIRSLRIENYLLPRRIKRQSYTNRQKTVPQNNVVLQKSKAGKKLNVHFYRRNLSLMSYFVQLQNVRQM